MKRKPSGREQLVADVVAARAVLDKAIEQTTKALERAQKASNKLGMARSCVEAAMFQDIDKALLAMRQASTAASPRN